MKYFSLRPPRDSMNIYGGGQNMNTFMRAQSPADVAGRVFQGVEDHFDDAGKQLKSYGIGVFYDALYVPADKASIIEDELNRYGVEFYTAEIITEYDTYSAFRTFNLKKPDDTSPMCRMPNDIGKWVLSIEQYYSEEFLDFLGKHFPMENFFRISP